ncbi:MAG TPA: ATP-binding protein, partial [Planctomycetota bacterium]|nr:ATP-binding protein [Planctomycetota bacterium]
DRPLGAILAVGLTLLLLGVAIALWAGRRISRPIEALVLTAQRLGRGETVEPVPSRVAEVSALSTALVDAGLEQARARSELARYAERLRILHDVDRALMAAEAPAAIAEAALRRLRPLLGAPRAVVTVFDLEAGEGEWLAVDASVPTSIGPGARFPLRMLGDLEALRRGEVQVIEDTAALGDIPQARALLAEGIRSFVVVPLVARGALIGSLNLGGAGLDSIRDDQIDLAREVAIQLAIALDQARLYERVRDQAGELEQRVRERTLELSEANQHLQEESADRRRAEGEADQANRAKSEFLSRMSHELRTPLNGILGFAQLLELEPLREGQKESTQQILRAGRHLLALINEVLDISRIEAGRLAISLEPVPVGDTVQGTLELVRPLAAEKGIDLRADIVDERRHVLADRQRLHQVLLNLFANAVKYNRPGGSVRISCEETAGDRLRIRVADTGPGMDPDKLERMFTPFDRLGAESSSVEGTGLGLTLSKHLVEVMGGTLSVESQVGVGSAFTVELPSVAAPAAAVPLVAPGRVDPAPESAALVILYIEDNLSNLRLVERIVARRPGVRLLSAMQGRLGFDLAREHQPDLILLDHHLPDIMGDEVLRLVREEPRTRDVPVVMLSADASPGQIARLLNAGARAYLTKPLDVAKLLALIDQTPRRRP